MTTTFQAIDALGGCSDARDVYGWAYNDAIGDALKVLTELGFTKEADATPPMYDRLVKLASSICGYADEFCKVTRESGDAEMMYARHDTIVVAEARAIMAELTPVDPDLVLAREMAIDLLKATVVSDGNPYGNPEIQRIRAGRGDLNSYVATCFAAIKRGRALASGATA